MTYRLLVFDVNETLLDLSPLRDHLAAISPHLHLGEWFARLLHRSLVANHLNDFRPFGELAAETLRWVAARAGVPLESADVDAFLDSMASLPPHPDVVEGLSRLQGLGMPMAALTNGSAAMARAQLGTAGLAGLLDDVLSVDEVRRFKPDPAPYRYAASRFGVEISEMLMIAAHDWDVVGAVTAGAGGCFVARQPWGMDRLEQHREVDNLEALAELLSADP